uniref:Uncharacterized protein n=1 Tax=Myotis myotis TaxID=51298 RepID=A0A7J7TIM8_MYOMY|nr:hypothetical protein mMyoMyo1_009039 [Myotis myotis]
MSNLLSCVFLPFSLQCSHTVSLIRDPPILLPRGPCSFSLESSSSGYLQGWLPHPFEIFTKCHFLSDYLVLKWTPSPQYSLLSLPVLFFLAFITLKHNIFYFVSPAPLEHAPGGQGSLFCSLLHPQSLEHIDAK